MSAVCRGCGKPIIWGVMGEKKIPLDPRPPVYTVVGLKDGQAIVQRLENALVSHFATCPNANDFSGGKKHLDKPAGI
jgi:hypothetical protein